MTINNPSTRINQPPLTIPHILIYRANTVQQVGCLAVDVKRQEETHHITSQGNKEKMSGFNVSIYG
jgi:hypothetical protein